jgi:hypothetical protein
MLRRVVATAQVGEIEYHVLYHKRLMIPCTIYLSRAAGNAVHRPELSCSP